MQRAPMSERFALPGRPGPGERFPGLRLVLGKQPYQWFCAPRTTHNNLIVGQDNRQSGLVCSSQQALELPFRLLIPSKSGSPTVTTVISVMHGRIPWVAPDGLWLEDWTYDPIVTSKIVQFRGC
jgi:hypothetical protein